MNIWWLRTLATVATVVVISVETVPASDSPTSPNPTVRREGGTDSESVEPNTDDDPFVELPKPVPRDSLEKSAAAKSQQLPRTIMGIVLDLDDNPVAGAKVILKLCRTNGLFGAEESYAKEQWSSSTNDRGVYVLQLDEVTVEPDDDLELQVTADEYSPGSSTIRLKEAVEGELPTKRIGALRADPTVNEARVLWDKWQDDTEAFNAEVAATVNGIPVLNGQVIDRYCRHLIDVRRKMQDAAADPNYPGTTPRPKDYEEYRGQIVLRELPACIQKVLVVQYLMERSTPQQKATGQRQIDELFKQEIEKLKKELNVTTIEECEAELAKVHSSLKNVREHFAFECLSQQCIAWKSQPSTPISERQILDCYESHIEQYKKPESVDWQQIGFKFLPGLKSTSAEAKLRQMLARLNEGESLDDIFSSFSNCEGIYRNSWKGTDRDSLISDYVVSQVFLMPLHHWSLMTHSPSSLVQSNNVAIEQGSELPSLRSHVSDSESLSMVGIDRTKKQVKISSLSAGSFSHNWHEVSAGLNSHSAPEAMVGQSGNVVADANKSNSTDPRFWGEFSLVCVTGRNAATRIPIEEVHDEIRDTLTKEQRAKKQLQFLSKLVSTAKIESFYSLPDYLVHRGADNIEQSDSQLSKASGSFEEESLPSMNAEELEQSIKEFDRAIEKNPTDASLYKDRGARRLLRRDFELAIADFDESIRRDPNCADVRYLRGIALMIRGRLDVARNDFDEAIRLSPEMVMVYFARGSLEAMMGKFDRVLADIDSAVQLAPDNPDCYCMRATAYLALDRLDEALADCDQAIRLEESSNRNASEPNNDRGNVNFRVVVPLGKGREPDIITGQKSSSHIIRGTVWFEKGDMQRAKVDCQKAIERNSQLPDAYMLLGRIYCVENDLDRAMEAVNKVIGLNPKYAEAYFARAAINQNRGALNEALADLEIAVQLQPTAIHFENRGMTYLQVGAIDKAFADFDEATRLDDKSINAFFGRSKIWESKKDVHRAVSELDRVLQLDPHHIDALRARGRHLLMLGQHDRAFTDFDDAIRLDKKGNSDAFTGRAISWAWKGDSEKALVDLDHAIVLNGEGSRAYYYRAILHLERKQFEPAMSDIDRSIQIDSTLSKAHCVRGDILSQMKQYEQAASNYDEAIRLDPNDMEVKIARSKCWTRLRQYERAVEELNEIIRVDSNNAKAYWQRAYNWELLNQLDNASADLDDAIRLLQPPDSAAYVSRGKLKKKKSDLAGAMADCDRAIDLDPRNAHAFALRGQISKTEGNIERALEDLNQTIRLDPDDTFNGNLLSWWLATDPDERYRDGRRAVELATKACELTKFQNDAYIDTLAAALAEVGNFDEAQKRQQQAMEMAPQSDSESRAKKLALFKAGAPYREASEARP